MHLVKARFATLFKFASYQSRINYFCVLFIICNKTMTKKLQQYQHVNGKQRYIYIYISYCLGTIHPINMKQKGLFLSHIFDATKRINFLYSV